MRAVFSCKRAERGEKNRTKNKNTMLLFRLDNAKKFGVFYPRGVGFDPHQCLQTETNSHFHFRLIHLDNRLEPRSR